LFQTNGLLLGAAAFRFGHSQVRSFVGASSLEYKELRKRALEKEYFNIRLIRDQKNQFGVDRIFVTRPYKTCNGRRYHNCIRMLNLLQILHHGQSNLMVQSQNGWLIGDHQIR
jgi:hypothetical protein